MENKKIYKLNGKQYIAGDFVLQSTILRGNVSVSYDRIYGIKLISSPSISSLIVGGNWDCKPSLDDGICTGYGMWDGASYLKKAVLLEENYMKKTKNNSVSLDSVILSADKKEEIRSAISQVENNDLIFSEWGFGDVFKKGTAISLLFYGIPGTGKTLTAQAIADEMGYELKIYGTADIETSEPGGAERMIKTIFAEAKKFFSGSSTSEKPHVILFDECDSLLMDRNEVGAVLGAQVNSLLSEIERYNGIVIFTTNRLGKLDPALERRITAKIEFPFPDKQQREQIWRRMIPKSAPIDENVDFIHLSEVPIAGGNIKNSVLNAARFAAYSKSKTIKMEHFVTAIEREAKSIHAFIAEYEGQTHTSPLGALDRSPGSVSITKKDIKKMHLAKKGASHE